MIFLGILDITDINPEIDYISRLKLGDVVKKRIEGTKNSESRASRIGAYTLLERMYGELKEKCGFPEEIPEIFYTGEGKPRFCDNNSLQIVPEFSISHDSSLCICAFSTSGEVGADVQSEPQRRINLAKIAERFFAPFCAIEKSREENMGAECEAEVFFYKLSGEDLIHSEALKASLRRLMDASSLSEFLPKWTLLEALLKMSGGGMRDTGRIEDLIAAARTAVYRLTLNGADYFISAAVKK